MASLSEAGASTPVERPQYLHISQPNSSGVSVSSHQSRRLDKANFDEALRHRTVRAFANARKAELIES